METYYLTIWMLSGIALFVSVMILIIKAIRKKPVFRAVVAVVFCLILRLAAIAAAAEQYPDGKLGYEDTTVVETVCNRVA